MIHSLSNRDVTNITKAIDMAKSHSSGGSYDMVALWVKGSNVIAGANALTRSASHFDPTYPSAFGFHAELDLARRLDSSVRGGTVYVAGRKARSNSIMLHTQPCQYCSPLLMLLNINWVVYLKDGKFIKQKVEDLYHNKS